MTKQEFIQELGACLLNEVDSQEYRNSMEYYSRYIDDEMRRGKSEQEVLEQLGSPRLIAKTIIDAQLGNPMYQRTMHSLHQEEDQEETQNQRRPFRMYVGGRELKWYEKVAIGAIVAFVLFLLLTFFIQIVLPIAIVLFVCKVIYNLLKK